MRFCSVKSENKWWLLSTNTLMTTLTVLSSTMKVESYLDILRKSLRTKLSLRFIHMLNRTSASNWEELMK